MKHQDTKPAVRIFRKQFWRQSGGFPAEEVEISRGVWNFGVVFGPCGFDQPKPSPAALGCVKGLPVGPLMPRDLLPIIHSSALQSFAAHLKSERLDKVKRSFCRRAESSDISGVGRNFGLDQDDVRRADYQGGGVPKTNKNFPRRGWGKPAQSLDRPEFSSTGVKIPAAR